MITNTTVESLYIVQEVHLNVFSCTWYFHVDYLTTFFCSLTSLSVQVTLNTDDFLITSDCFCVQASRVRDSMAKSLYSALFDWIIVHINHAMLNRRDMEESVSVSSIEL